MDKMIERIKAAAKKKQLSDLELAEILMRLMDGGVTQLSYVLHYIESEDYNYEEYDE